MFDENGDILDCLPIEFAHKPLGWLIRHDFKNARYSLDINGVKYGEMAEAPPRERAALARTAITMKTDGPKKSVRFGLMRKGEYIGVSAVLNMHTKFAKLSVGKHVVSASRHSSQDQLFPLTIALSGLAPLSKVWIDFLSQPKNTFVIRINDADIYSLTKEEVDYDPSQTEELRV